MWVVMRNMSTGIAGMAAERLATTHDAAAGLSAAGLAAVLAAALAVSMAYGVTLPVLPFLLERLLGPSSAAGVARHTGWLTGAYTFALFFLSPLWGVLSDRIDRRAVMLVGLLGSAASLLALDWVTGLAGLYLARIASGALSAAVLPAALAYVADSCAAEQRPRQFALVASATTVGFLLGPATGSWLAPMVLTVPADMRIVQILMPDSPFFVVAIANLLATVALMALPARIRAGAVQAVTAAADEPVIRRALLLTAFVVFGITTAEVGITLFGSRTLELGPRGISAFFAVCSVVMIVAQAWGYPYARRALGDRMTLGAAFALMALGLALVPWGDSSSWVGAAFALAAGGTGILIPALATRISEAAAARQGSALGRQAAAANLGQAVAAASTGMLFASAPAAPFLVAAALLAAGVVIAARG